MAGTLSNNKVKVLVRGPIIEIDGVKFHLHLNGGGMVAENAKVAVSATIGVCARVLSGATVCSDARILGRSVVGKDAIVESRALLRDSILGDYSVVRPGFTIENFMIPDKTTVAGNLKGEFDMPAR